MKKCLFKICFVVILSAILSLAFSSCISEIESLADSGSPFVEEDVDALAKGYSSLYSDLFKTIMQDYKQILDSGLQINMNEYSKNILDSYMSRLTPEESKLIHRTQNFCNTRSSEHSTKIITIPEELENKIKSVLLNEDLNLLIEEVNKFYDSPYFLSLSCKEQQELRIQLESLKNIRNSVIEIMIDHIQDHEGVQTKMSPGDRMIWSRSVSQMSQRQVTRLVDATLLGISFVTVGPSAATVGIISFLAGYFW